MTNERLRYIKEIEARIQKALNIAKGGLHDGAHHKQWVIDQMVRTLTGCPEIVAISIDKSEYKKWLKTLRTEARGPYTPEEVSITLGESEAYLKWVSDMQSGEDGPLTYEWDIGMPP